MRKKFRFKDFLWNKKDMLPGEYGYARIGFTIDAVCDGAAAAWLSPLVALLTWLGMKEAPISFVVSLASAAGLLQLFIPSLTGKRTHKKPFIFLMRLLSRPVMALAFCLPFIIGRNLSAAVCIAVVYFITSVFTNFYTPLQQIWFMDCAKWGGGVGKYFGAKDGICNVGRMLSYLVSAIITSTFIGEQEGYAYLSFGVLAFIMAVFALTAIFFIKEPPIPHEEKKQKVNVLATAKEMFANPKIRRFLLYIFVFTFAHNFTGVVMGVYQIQRLHLTVSFLSILTVGDLIIESIMAPIWGRFSTKLGMRRLLMISILLIGSSFIPYIFATRENAKLIAAISVFISAMGFSAYGFSSFSYMFEVYPEANRSAYMVCGNTMSSVFTYGVSLLGTFCLAVFGGFTFTIGRFSGSIITIILMITVLGEYLSVYVLHRAKRDEVKKVA